MKVDHEKIQRYLLEIKARHHEIEVLLQKTPDKEILKEPWVVKGLKYTLVEIAEAMADILQHILAKDMGEPVAGYVETIIRAGQTNILPESLSKKLKPFFDTFDGAKSRFLNRGKKCRSVSTPAYRQVG
jgi:uncharacterized protein YutE (UPF0331/DUF86 family)